ncbi:MAG: multidrug efflux MFS transporter [Firmicutes bacterium]|uniref:Multidrug efflux MFS transporter n=1 Tax=Candidatus Gallilactobacillus intestinavium TaxID=2840838 RepID=A0A9D9E878_9LACO|nr:multidrug efflux MFS transporter [Candidatus Gallilactobacillus intestinavium]
MQTDVYGKKYNRNVINAIGILGVFVCFLPQTLLTTALPSLMKDFNVSVNTIQWLNTGYLLMMGVMIPITGWLMDRFNSRSLYLSAMVIFSIGTVICCIVDNFPCLLIGRILQAMGGGVVLPLTQAMTMYMYPINKRGFIMGIRGLAIGFAPAIGPCLSGWILMHYSWHLLFQILIPLIILDLILSTIYMRNIMPNKANSLDWYSGILSVIGFGSLLYGFSYVGKSSWTNHTVILCLIIAIIVLTLFFHRQTKLSNPFLNIKLLKIKPFTINSTVGAIARMSFIGIELIIPLYLQIVHKLTPLQSGLVLLPGAICMGLLSPVAGKFLDKFGPKKVILAGTIILAFGTFDFVFINAHTSILRIIIMYTIRIIGVSFILMPSTTASINALSQDQISQGSAINNTFRQVSGSIATAIFTSVLTTTKTNFIYRYIHTINSQNQLHHLILKASIYGYRSAFFTALIICFIGIFLACFTKNTNPKK